MSLPKIIVANIRTNSKYGLFNPGDKLIVGKDIDESGAARWLENGIARAGNLKVKKSDKPTSDSTVKQIKDYLDSEGIEYKSTAKKDELLELV